MSKPCFIDTIKLILLSIKVNIQAFNSICSTYCVKSKSFISIRKVYSYFSCFMHKAIGSEYINFIKITCFLFFIKKRNPPKPYAYLDISIQSSPLPFSSLKKNFVCILRKAKHWDMPVINKLVNHINIKIFIVFLVLLCFILILYNWDFKSLIEQLKLYSFWSALYNRLKLIFNYTNYNTCLDVISKIFKDKDSLLDFLEGLSSLITLICMLIYNTMTISSERSPGESENLNVLFKKSAGDSPGNEDNTNTNTNTDKADTSGDENTNIDEGKGKGKGKEKEKDEDNVVSSDEGSEVNLKVDKGKGRATEADMEKWNAEGSYEETSMIKETETETETETVQIDYDSLLAQKLQEEEYNAVSGSGWAWIAEAEAETERAEAIARERAEEVLSEDSDFYSYFTDTTINN